MALLRPYEQRGPQQRGGTDDPAAPADEAGAEVSAPLKKGQTAKKGQPTRSRAAAEAERMARLHPQLTKKQQRAANRSARGQAADEAVRRRQSSPERQLMRDYVDARWTVTEFLMPVMLVLIAISLASCNSTIIQSLILAALLGLMAAWAVNVYMFWHGFKREARQRIPHPDFRSLLLEMNSRMMNIRRFRRPSPRINRGDSY